MTNKSAIENAESMLLSFSEIYNGLPEGEKFKLGSVFREKTGGCLSPYNSPNVVVVGAVLCSDENQCVKILGVRRAIAPFIGEIALPGGFLNENESPIRGLTREILEETGIDLSWLSTFKPKPVVFEMGHNNRVLAVYESEVIVPYASFLEAQSKLSNNEVSELVLIDPETPICFPIHKQAICEVFVNL